MNNIKLTLAITGIISFSLVSFAYANAGVPLIGFYLPPAWLTLVPIIFIEAFIGFRNYSLPFKTSLISVTTANFISTIIGIPLTWLVWASIEGVFFGGVVGEHPISWAILSVTVQAAWLLPYEEHLWWMGPMACLFLSIVFYFVSVVIEYQVVKSFFKEKPCEILRSWVLISNIYSYIVLFLLSALLITFYKELNFLIRVFDPITNWLVSIIFHIAEIIK